MPSAIAFKLRMAISLILGFGICSVSFSISFSPFSILHTSVREAHGFAQAGGVMGAVKAYLKEEAEKINAIQVSDINKKNIALLRACAKTGKAAGQFIEVMACEGGCITGPSTHNDIVSGRRQLAQELLKRKESYETMDR